MPPRFNDNQRFETRGAQREDFAENLSVCEQTTGRGWQVFDYEIELEPVFSELIPPTRNSRPIDDGRVPTLFNRLFSSKTKESQCSNKSNNNKLTANSFAQLQPTPKPAVPTAAFRIYLPNELKTSAAQTGQMLLNLASSASFFSFEIIGTGREIIFQIACPEQNKQSVLFQLKSHLPQVDFRETQDALTTNLRLTQANETVAVDFGLGREWFIPLPFDKTLASDSLLPLIASFEEIAGGEIIWLQILLSRARNNWQQAAREMIFDHHGKLALPQLENCLPTIKEKLSSPLFAAQIRLVVQNGSKERSLQITKRTSPFFKQFFSPSGNELIPLRNEGLEPDKHLKSILNRTTFRSGMLLCAEELAALVHLPSDEVKSEKIGRDENCTKLVPEFAAQGNIVLGENLHRGVRQIIRLSDAKRVKHLWLTGSSGSGKTSLINFLVEQDIKAGNGVTVIEPHGDSIESIIACIPETRLKDVILFDPADENFPIPFNPLEAHSELEKTLLASDLAAVLQGFWISQGDIISNVLHNSIIAFLSSATGGTLIDLKHFLIDRNFREKFLATVSDEEIRFYWTNEFPPLSRKITPLLTRLDLFLRSKIIRNILASKENKLDFRRILDERKILLVKLTHGAIGEAQAHMLGAIVMTKIYQAALSRQNLPETSRVNHFIYLDEAHHFIVPSLSLLLSGGRKFGCSLLFSHQETKQITSRDAELLSSLQTNCFTRICFRADSDAELLAKGFSFFTAEHLRNLGVGEAVCRFEQSRYDFNLKTFPLESIKPEIAEKRRNAVIEHSRKLYAKPKSEIEDELMSHGPAKQEQPPTISEKNIQIKSEVLSQTAKPFVQFETALFEKDIQTDNAHRYLQNIVKRIGENSGFVATLEKQVFGGVGKIDVALENESLKIACEIAVTNTVEYELQNIQKCLASGFDKVAVISTDAKHLVIIRRRAETVISESQLLKVYFLEPDNFHLFLDSLNQQSNTENKIKGYTVNVGFKETPEKEADSRKQTVFEILSGVIKRKGGNDKK